MLTQPELLSKQERRYFKSKRIEKRSTDEECSKVRLCDNSELENSGSNPIDILGWALTFNLVTSTMFTFGLNQIYAVLKIR